MRYILFYKPYGVLSQFTDRSSIVAPSGREGKTVSYGLSEHRQTLKSFISIPSVYPVGRLDRDSEGLLMLTDDGKLASRLIHPRYGHARTYWAQVEGIPSRDELLALHRGVVIKGRKTKPAEARSIQVLNVPPRSVPIRERRSIPTSWLELVLREGRNRQVRRMTAAIGYPTLRLIRARIATLTLEGLAPGQWRDLTPEELIDLRSVVR